METRKIVYLSLLFLGLGITLFYVLSQISGGEAKAIENSFKEIEIQCASAQVDAQAISNTFASKTGCIEEKISELASSYDPETVALIGFDLYGNPNYPVLNRACHPAMHVLGSAKALSTQKELRSPIEELKGCSLGFWHGYSEAAMVNLSSDELVEKGFEVCAKVIEGLDQGYSCAHTYGHFLYNSLEDKINVNQVGNLTKQCEKLGKGYTELCVAGIFMDYFTSDAVYKELSDNETNFNARHLLRPCYINPKTEVTMWCITVSWEVLYKAAVSEFGKTSKGYDAFQGKCQELPEDAHFYCGMSLAFPIVRTNTTNIEQNIKDCVEAGQGSDLVTSGCITWGGRWLWWNTRNYDLFLEMCTNENNKKRGSCLSHDLHEVEGKLSWNKLTELVS